MASSSVAAVSKITLSQAETETEEKTCRLCWGDEDDGPLVQPCACRGSAKWIHAACLEEWRRTSPKGDAAYRCGQCRDEYRDALSLELLRGCGPPAPRRAHQHAKKRGRWRPLCAPAPKTRISGCPLAP